jgi:hypothetical protein
MTCVLRPPHPTGPVLHRVTIGEDLGAKDAADRQRKGCALALRGCSHPGDRVNRQPGRCLSYVTSAYVLVKVPAGPPRGVRSEAVAWV